VPASSGSGETIRGQALGTPAYISPEQAKGELERLGPTSDVYSLGATLYCLLTGKPPYEGAAVDVLPRVPRGEFPRPRGVEPGIDPALEAVCLKAMALKPEDRYAGCRALADDLEHWLADEPVTAYPEPVAVKLGRWVRRHKSAVAATVVALSISAVVLSLAAISLARINERLARANRAAGDRLIRLELARADSLWRRDPRHALDVLMDPDILPKSERKFYWWHLRGLCERSLEGRLTLGGHTGIVSAVAFRPDGKMLTVNSESMCL
jgi:hypothetical protein